MIAWKSSLWLSWLMWKSKSNQPATWCENAIHVFFYRGKHSKHDSWLFIRSTDKGEGLLSWWNKQSLEEAGTNHRGKTTILSQYRVHKKFNSIYTQHSKLVIDQGKINERGLRPVEQWTWGQTNYCLAPKKRILLSTLRLHSYTYCNHDSNGKSLFIMSPVLSH